MQNSTMKVLIIGGGGREHALYESIKKSPLVNTALCAPGNGGIPTESRRPVENTDIDGLVQLTKREHIDLVVIGPEAPLAAGLTDELAAYTRASVFGPSKAAARIESNKLQSKLMCQELGIPTARFQSASDIGKAEQIIRETGFRVVKASGLCAGKGVTVAKNKLRAMDAAREALVSRKFGDAGSTVVIEEVLKGDECSVIALCDGENAELLPPAQDYKRLNKEESSPNTGGMGAYAPVPGFDDAALRDIKERFILPVLRHMHGNGTPFRGALYAGLIRTKTDLKLLEYNARFGDPETQPQLLLLACDIVPYLLACSKQGGLADLPTLKMRSGVAVGIVLASDGYPEKYQTGYPITGIHAAEQFAQFVHSGTEYDTSGTLVTSGGRVGMCVGFDENGSIKQARKYALQGAGTVKFDTKYFRSDIADI